MTTKLLFWLYCYQYIYIWKLMKTFLWALNLVKLSFQQKKEIVALDKKKVNLCPGSKISTQIMSHFTIFVANHDKNLKNNRECELLWKLGKNCVKNLFCWVSICARAVSSMSMGRALNILLDSIYFGMPLATKIGKFDNGWHKTLTPMFRWQQ